MTNHYIQDSHDFTIPFLTHSKKYEEISHELLKFSYGDEREQYIMDHYLGGHIPSSCRNFFPIQIEFSGAISKSMKKAILYVAGEYISLGTDEKYIRCPLNPLTAQKIADLMGCVLPTPAIVDAIWKTSHIKLPPLPWGPPYNASMMSSNRIIKHSNKIDDQLEKCGIDPSGDILAGHKKDVVMHNILKLHSNKVAIYGWHQSNGIPIQGLYYSNATHTKNPYTGHVNTYADYSHGIRLVDQEVWIDDNQGNIEKTNIITASNNVELWPAFGTEMQTLWRQPQVSTEKK